MRVLLVRLDGIGDAAVCTPLLAALRDAGHQVGVALTTRNAGLFAPSAIVAEHVLDRIPWPAHGSTPESTARAQAEIAAQRYDVALIASEEPEAFELAAPIGERVGFTTGWARPLKTLWVRARTTRAVERAQQIGGEDAHEVEVLYRLGVAAQLVASAAPSADPARLRPLICDGGDGSRDYVLLQAGMKWAASGVPDATLAEVVARLEPYDVRVVAGPAEVELVRTALGVVPETFADLRSWVEALDCARCVVTVDTGAAHVAGMLGTPVVDVFPDAHFVAQVRRWRPWAAPYRALRASAVAGGAGRPVVEAVLDGI
jgi:ADP-heptose:LPS heptosyltransferase